MKYKYGFVNGEVEIEVSKEWAEILREMDRIEFNNDHAETRRHVSLSALYDRNECLIDHGCDPLRILIAEEDKAQFENAFMQQTAKQADAVWTVCVNGVGITTYAREQGITVPTARERLESGRKKIKKYL